MRTTETNPLLLSSVSEAAQKSAILEHKLLEVGKTLRRLHPCSICGKMTVRAGNCFRHRNRSTVSRVIMCPCSCNRMIRVWMRSDSSNTPTITKTELAEEVVV